MPAIVPACLLYAQSFTIDQVLSAPFPSDLTTQGGKVAWVSNLRGVRNVMVAEPPEYKARAVTAYTGDDGQELTDLRWPPDASALVYTRGGELNPTNDPNGVAQAIWIAPLTGAPRKLAEGASPAVSPKGDRVAFLRGGQIWLAALDGKTPPARAFQTRGTCSRPVWSPDSSKLVTSVNRGDHSFLAVYDNQTLRFLDPSTDHDLYPAWSPDSKSVVFVRTPSDGLRAVRQARRIGTPWSIRIADATTGAGREIWHAAEGRGSVYREVVADNQLLWTAAGRIVFPWEADGWTHLYAIASTGGNTTLLTPGNFEVEDVSITGDRREIIFSSNQGDIDRRHLWRLNGTALTQLTTGEGIECKPASDLAFLRADAQRPMHPAVRVNNEIRDLESPPADFPTARMVKPQPVTFPSTDGLTLHGQLFVPPNASAKSPALVFFHGGSRRQMLLGWHPMYYYHNAYALNQYFANAGYIVLSVNYRSGIGYGMEFREALNYGPSGGSEYNDVRAAGEWLRKRADVDAARIGAWGGSYGGYLTAMALARSSELYRAGVDFHGVHDWAKEIHIPEGAPDYRTAFESSPLHFVKDWRSPVLLIHGDDDDSVQFNQTVMLKDALRRQKTPLEELILPGEGHDFVLWRSWRDTYTATVDFFARRLK
jgi:dipeptidyl aminopeptidase/acylaminoacyl peptidase